MGMNKRLSVLAIFLYQLISTNAVMAAPEWRVTHFGSCFSEDGIMQADGSWWWYEQGRGVVNPVKYGGSYITTRRTISTNDYGSRKNERYDATGINLQNIDGTWVDTFYLQISDVDVICKM